MKKNLLSTAAAALALILGASGCQDTVNTVENRDLAMNPDSVDTRAFSTDSFCRDRLALISMRRSKTPGGVMMVQAQIRSERYGFWSELWSGMTGTNPYYVLYRFDWMDENGMAVSTAANAWQPLIFAPGEVKFIQGVAPNSRCKDFILSVREDPSAR
ncbi:MAG: YcfL family protein [Lentisphaeria bacterium]|nr:YcfL family protein [Lentisphaeria bacterium]